MDSVLKWHGGKYYLRQTYIDLMPPHTHYVEDCFGAGWVMFAKNPQGISEVANDVNRNLINFWNVLRDPNRYAEFKRWIELTPFARSEFQKEKEAWNRHIASDPEYPDRYLTLRPEPNDTNFKDGLVNIERTSVRCAINLFIRCRMSRAANFKSFTPLTRTRTRGGMNAEANAWINAIGNLPAVHARLQRIVVECVPCAELVRRESGKRTLHFIDPPYLGETRTSPDVYENEMTIEKHAELLEVCNKTDSMVMLCGYRSDMYDNELTKSSGWTLREYPMANHVSGAKSKREMIECLWTNF